PRALRPPSSTLFPYTTLFRSVQVFNARGGERRALLTFPRPVAVSFFPGTKKLAVASQKSGAPDRDGEVLFHDVEANQADGEPIKDRKSTRLNSSHVKISYAVF